MQHESLPKLYPALDLIAFNSRNEALVAGRHIFGVTWVTTENRHVTYIECNWSPLATHCILHPGKTAPILTLIFCLFLFEVFLTK